MSWLEENDCCGSRHDVINPEVCADCPLATMAGNAGWSCQPSWMALTGDRDTEWGADE